jgi:hypothetical protein
MNNPGQRSDWKETGFEHFLRIYHGLDAAEIAQRCGLPLDNGAFPLVLMGEAYTAAHPRFSLTPVQEHGAVPDIAGQMLVLRYLCGGKAAPSTGTFLSYREVPWGETYFANFEGRCIKRLARMYTENPGGFNAFFAGNPGLHAAPLERTPGWRFEFMTNLYFSFIVWPGDDEFPAQGQILFDDNVPAAFTAEDLAVAGDFALSRIKKALASHPPVQSP